MPLGPQIAYDIETSDGGALKVVVARTGARPDRQPGEAVHLAPASPEACHVFAASDQ